MSVSTNHIPLFSPCAIRDAYRIKADTMQYTQYELWYPFFGEFAGLVKQQNLIYVRHHFLLIYSGNALMPSMAFSGGLAGLAEAAAEGYEYQSQQSNN